MLTLRSSVKVPPPWHDQMIHWMSHCILHLQNSCWRHHNNKWCKVESVSISSSLQWGPEVACTSTSRHTSAFGLCATSGSNLCPCGPCMTKLVVCEASWRGHVFWSLAADSAPIVVQCCTHRRFQSNRTVPRRSNLGTRFSQPARQSKGYLKCFAGSVYEPSSKIQALRSIFKSEPHKVKCSECAFTISSSYSSWVSLKYVFYNLFSLHHLATIWVSWHTGRIDWALLLGTLAGLMWMIDFAVDLIKIPRSSMMAICNSNMYAIIVLLFAGLPQVHTRKSRNVLNAIPFFCTFLAVCAVYSVVRPLRLAVPTSKDEGNRHSCA